MNKRSLKSIILLLAILIYTVVYKIVILSNLLNLSQTITACFIAIMFFVSIWLYGFERSKLNGTKKNIIFGIIISLAFYFAIIYGLGFALGFLRNSYSMELLTMINNTFFLLAIVVFMELLRYNFIRSNRDRKYYVIIFTIILIVFEIVFNISSNSFQSKYDIFVFITKIIIPISTKNYVLSYLAYQVGYIPTLIYNVIFSTYFYIVPVLPNLGDFLESVSLIILPLFIYIYSSRVIYLHENKEELEFESPGFKLVDIPGLLIILVFAYLISGFGIAQIVGIGSQSMMPKINKGDAVIIVKNIDKLKLKKGDIISFDHNGRRVIHRINKVKEIDGKILYETKGDANNAPDGSMITKNKIEGKVLFKIPYIAYPTIWISELIS